MSKKIKRIFQNNKTSGRKIVFSLSLIAILFVSTFIGIIPLISTIVDEATPPPNQYTEIPPYNPLGQTVAGEPNFTRDGFAFILNNYPDFQWKNPGQFNSELGKPGYDSSLPAPGTGAQAYQPIYDELLGLNESNIRIAYMNAAYEWVIVPYQIDQKGWANVWQVNDRNKWHGINAPVVGWTGYDPSIGLGWINGDPAASCGDSGQDGKITWYQTPTWTYLTKYQPDGSYTDENVNIPSATANDLVNTYEGGITSYPASGWGYDGNGNEAYIKLEIEPDTSVTVAETIFIGDTWFRTPDSSLSAYGINGFNYDQINGALDRDDEIVFYAYPGRQAPTYLWWNAPEFPQRLELEIVDPVDGGRCWMYIYYNNDDNYNPMVNSTAVNLGAPTFTTPVTDYASWDPDSMTITTEYYQISVDETNPSLLDSAKMFGDSDGQKILRSFNKMYGYGTYSAMDLIDGTMSAGREGIWYHWESTTQYSFSELVCTLDNPAVWYTSISEDTNDPNRAAATSPQYYYGPMAYSERGSHGIPSGAQLLEDWEDYGDGRAIIDGPCRVLMYLQQYLMTGIYAHLGSPALDEWIDVFTSIMDGPMFYYQRMQKSPYATTAMPYMGADITITINYVYIMCGNIENTIRGDYNLTAAQEWTGGTDNNDDGVPSFGWDNLYGYTKMGPGGGLDPKTSTYAILGSSIPDGNDGSGDFYSSRGDPVNGYQSTVPTGTISGTGAGTSYTGNARLADWYMITSETHGGLWIYVPRREVLEIRDNYRLLDRHSPTAVPKMYYRDDSYQAEFGICLDGGATTVRGGSSTSPYAFMMVYGDFDDASVSEIGHKLYLQYYFPLEGISSFNVQTAPPSFHYETVQPDELVYKRGETITINVYGDRDDATIGVNFTDVDAGGPLAQVMTNLGSGLYTTTYTIADVSHGTDYERDIYLRATVPTFDTAYYTLTVTVDDIAPSPGASLATLTTPISEAVVYLDWRSNSGFDKGSASQANPSGIDHYRIRRGPSGGPYNTVVATIPHDVTNVTHIFGDTFVEHGQTYGWVIDTYDAVGNYVTSSQVFTTIDLPYTPAQPDALPATMNPPGGAVTIDWTANPGYGAGVTITGYELHRSTQIDTGYISVWSGSATSRPDSMSWVEATTYYWKVRTMTSGPDLFSAPVWTRIDRVNPQPAELATPFDPYQSQSNELVVSWALETLPQYSSGGFPGHDLNGVDHWVIEKRVGAGSWGVLATVAYGPETEDQLIRDTAVSSGTQYSYRITTYDAAGNSAPGLYVKTTTLQVIGLGRIEVFSLTPGASTVKQGETAAVTVTVWNPGADAVTLTKVQLNFFKVSANVTEDYSNNAWTGSQVFAAFGTTDDIVITVDIDQSAILGDITITAFVRWTGAGGGEDTGPPSPPSWLVSPDADLVAVTVQSSTSVVHPGEADIPVSVLVDNPGASNAIVEEVQLVFMRGETDISSDFMVEYITSIPTSGFTGQLAVSLKVTVGMSVTQGGVTLDAKVFGESGGIPISDTDGADTTDSWAVSTWPVPVISNIEADAEVYWDNDVIILTVTCDKAGHTTVRAYMETIDTGQGWVNGVDNGDATYTITDTITNPPGEGTYDVAVEAINASGTGSDSISIRLGQAPTFANPQQTPATVTDTDTVQIDIEIHDNGGDDNVQATYTYRTDGGAWKSPIAMTYLGSGDWRIAALPAQPATTVVDYRINATDLTGNWATYTDSYTVTGGGPELPDFVPGSDSIHDPASPGTEYNMTVHAPLNTDIAHSITVDGSLLSSPTVYTVLISVFDPARDCFLNINGSVTVPAGGTIDVTLTIQFSGAIITQIDTLIVGKFYIMTGLPSEGGIPVTKLSFSYICN